MKPKNIAIILAGGVGTRLGLSLPKQFFKVAGKTVIEHTIDVFETCYQIDEIAIVSNNTHLIEIENLILKNSWTKVKKVLVGGSQRHESSLVAIKAYENCFGCNLVFHDAVRPLVTSQIIEDSISALQHCNAVDVAVPAIDTIIEVSNGIISSIPDRSKLMRGQTPQSFKYEVIRKAYELALGDPHFKSTDDCGVVKQYLPDEKIFVLPGNESNIKLTYKEDAFLLDKLFQLKSSVLGTNIPLLEALKDKVVVVFGGNSGIGKEIVDLGDYYCFRGYSFSRSTSTDIADRTSVRSALRSVYMREGKIDYIINTAAILRKEPLLSMDNADILEIVNTNYLGTINVSIESFPYLSESKGSLLFFTSSSYTRGRAFYSLYSSSKAAIVNFVQALAQEWDFYGIKVNCINPERTKTPMRVANFGMEPDESLLKAEIVAQESLKTLVSEFTGQIIDVKISPVVEAVANGPFA